MDTKYKLTFGILIIGATGVCSWIAITHNIYKSPEYENGQSVESAGNIGVTNQTLNHQNSISVRARKVIADTLGIEESRIHDSSRFVEDLDADSLDTVEIVMAIEYEFDIEIPDVDAEKIENFGSVAQYLLNRNVGIKVNSEDEKMNRN